MGKLELGIMFRKKHDLAVSSRGSEFNVDIIVPIFVKIKSIIVDDLLLTRVGSLINRLN